MGKKEGRGVRTF